MGDSYDPLAPESSGGKLSRHASQNSLDECSRKSSPKIRRAERPPYRNYLHAHKVLDVMNLMRKENLMCDVKLVAEGKEIYAHRTVLAGCSRYFVAMFTKFEERTLETVTLQGIDSIALELLVQYMYTAEIFVTEENVQSLLPAANILQLTDVRDACCEFLETQLHSTNVLGIRAFADLHGCTKLFQHAENFAAHHFMSVIGEDEFLALSVDQVISLIQNDKLVVPSEEEVFESVMVWIKHDEENRKVHLSSIMEHVRLPLTTKEYLMERVEPDPLIQSNLYCKDYIIEALKYHLLKMEEKYLLHSVRTKARQTGFPKVLFIVGGQAPKAIRSVECYNIKEDRWFVMHEMPTRRCRAGVVTVNGKVYAIGGFNGSLRVKTVDVYDIASDTWNSGVPMEARRSTLGVAMLGNKIYAVGGFDGSIGLETAEVFDPRNQQWSYIASMSTRRSSVGVGVVNNMLYAVGGYDGFSRQCLSSVECYNPETDTWQVISEMGSRRSGAGVGVLDGILYAVGGHDGPVVRNTVEVYDPAVGTWTSIANMHNCRRNAGVVAYMGSLYVVGGDDGSTNLSSVEVYCPKTNTWNTLTRSMTIGRSYAGVALIDKPSNM